MTGEVANGETKGSKRYGVLIASSRFPDDPKLSELTCPENDVDGIHAVLQDQGIGGFAELQMVKNQPSHEALRKIHKILRKAGRDDLVLIYYAGHGKLDRAGRLHLATVETTQAELETTSIPAQRIRDLIDNADATKIALILDCCYSGAIDKSFLRGDVAEQLNVVAGGRGTFIMTASTDVQTAREEVRDGYGVFTKHLIDGLRGAADVDGDGVVTMNELYDYVHRQVLAESHQVPMKWNLNVEGEMIIARTGRKPREERRLALRARLFQLADEGLLPDMVFTKALEITNLPFEETRQGAAARYDALLDRLQDENLRVGDFLSDWLQVQMLESAQPAPIPKAEPEPAPEEEPVPEPAAWAEETDVRPGLQESEDASSRKARPAPPDDENLKPQLPPDGQRPDVGWFWKLAVFPYPATQENLDRHPLYRLFHAKEVKAREMAMIAADRKPPVNWLDVMVCIGWLIMGFPVMVMFAQGFESDNISYFGLSSQRTDEELSGALTGAIIWLVLGWVLRTRASHRLNRFLNAIYLLGFAGCIVMIGWLLFSVINQSRY